jgi:hypothetical protein
MKSASSLPKGTSAGSSRNFGTRQTSKNVTANSFFISRDFYDRRIRPVEKAKIEYDKRYGGLEDEEDRLFFKRRRRPDFL